MTTAELTCVAGQPPGALAERERAHSRMQRRRIRTLRARLDVTLSIYAHANLDAMREALDSIESHDL